MIIVKNSQEIAEIRKACKLTAQCLEYLGTGLEAGMTPIDIDCLCYEWARQHGCMPATLNYSNYKYSVCVSVNDVVCHGVPTHIPLHNKDIVSIDVTLRTDAGYYGDTCKTYIIGDYPTSDQTHLLYCAETAMTQGIQTIKPGTSFGEIGIAIESYVKTTPYSVVREYGGHGVGCGFHEEPWICHCINSQVTYTDTMKPGMIFTVEPMLTVGNPSTVKDLVDKWTVRTVDGSKSAQYEHTVLVTDNGYEILTKP